jgi:uncharacterized protein
MESRMGWGSLRRAAIRLAAYALSVYLIVGAVFYFTQDEILFPAPKSFDKTVPRLPYEDLRILVKETEYLHAWWIPAAQPTGKVVLVFHGNGYVLEDMASDEVLDLKAIGVDLLLVDYRGYGSSTRVSPNERTVNEDTIAGFNYLLFQRRIDVGKVFILGRSIGSGPATFLALRNSALGGLILESPFSSIDDAAAGSWYFQIYPLGLMLRTHFDNQSKIGSVHVPLLIVSGAADTLTPKWMAERLFAKANQPKQLYLVPQADHNDLLNLGGDELTQVLREFVLKY